MVGCHARCLHRQLVSDYRDARDARDALREQGDQMQMEDEEFNEQFPIVTFKMWLQDMEKQDDRQED